MATYRHLPGGQCAPMTNVPCALSSRSHSQRSFGSLFPRHVYPALNPVYPDRFISLLLPANILGSSAPVLLVPVLRHRHALPYSMPRSTRPPRSSTLARQPQALESGPNVHVPAPARRRRLVLVRRAQRTAPLELALVDEVLPPSSPPSPPSLSPSPRFSS